MANYATNKFCALVMNSRDLDTIERFISENFSDNYMVRHGQCIEGNFISNGSVPKKRWKN